MSGIKTAKERLPEVESEKKAAVSKKNVKDAAKFSAEAKALADGQSKAEATLKDLEGKVEEAEQQVGAVGEVVESLGEDLSAAEAEEKKLQHKHLKITIDMLSQAMEAAAQEENFDEAAALQTEIEVAQELKLGIEGSLDVNDAEDA